jgi:hemerythrin-like domain-containing protein
LSRAGFLLHGGEPDTPKLPKESAMTKAKTKHSSDALALLKEDHDKVKKAFKEFEKLDHEDTAALKELVTTVCEDLKTHTAIEEEIFYPAVRAEIEDDDLMNEAKIEHQSAKDLIEQLEKLEPDDELYAPTFTVLAEYVRHHIEEEEGEMFPAVKKLDLDLEDLATQMKERKEELMAAA